MYLTLGEMQGHLLSACLASVVGQCPMHRPSLEGTCHCENGFDKEQGSIGTHPRAVEESHLQRVRSLLPLPRTTSPQESA